MGRQAGAAILENSMEVLQKAKQRTTLQPSNCTTRHLSKGSRCAVLKGPMHPHVYSSTINSSQSMERAQMSIDGWMDKEDVVYIYNAVLLGNQKKMKSCHLQLCGWNWRVLCFVKLVREREISYDFTHMRTLRDKTDEHKGRETKIKIGRASCRERV